MSLQPVTVSASGFSTRTCLPASNASQTSGWWRCGSVVMSTAVTSGAASSSAARLGYTRGRAPSSAAAVSAKRFALRSLGSHSAATRKAGIAPSARAVAPYSFAPKRCRVPMPPQPTIARAISSIQFLHVVARLPENAVRLPRTPPGGACGGLTRSGGAGGSLPSEEPPGTAWMYYGRAGMRRSRSVLSRRKVLKASVSRVRRAPCCRRGRRSPRARRPKLARRLEFRRSPPGQESTR